MAFPFIPIILGVAGLVGICLGVDSYAKSETNKEINKKIRESTEEAIQTINHNLDMFFFRRTVSLVCSLGLVGLAWVLDRFQFVSFSIVLIVYYSNLLYLFIQFIRFLKVNIYHIYNLIFRYKGSVKKYGFSIVLTKVKAALAQLPTDEKQYFNWYSEKEAFQIAEEIYNDISAWLKFKLYSVPIITSALSVIVMYIVFRYFVIPDIVASHGYENLWETFINITFIMPITFLIDSWHYIASFFK